ncbi:MAG: hypothetical protein HZB53_00965 [Chloroflexi bacterium]|nr:hypothetical protein [Chloroflexota bacterium]
MVKQFKLATGAALAFVLTLMLAGMVSAAAPNPTYGSAVVDGNRGEWNLTSDFFSNMCTAFDCSKPTTAKLYLRYDCSTQTMYALVKVQPGSTLDSTSTNDAWLAVNTISNKVVSKSSGNNGTPPDFAWLSTNDGYEASFSAASYGTSFNIKAHINVNGGNTSGTPGFVSVSIACPSIRASTTRSGNLANNNVAPGTKISDTLFLTGTLAAPIAGTVQFYYCAGTLVTLPNCNSDPLTAIGSPVNVTAGTNGGLQVAKASSANTSFGAGSYCFKAVFTPASGSPYPSVSETNQLDTGGRAECIRVSGATAVMVSSFEASSTPAALDGDLALAGMGLAGMLALGGVALAAWRKR